LYEALFHHCNQLVTDLRRCCPEPCAHPASKLLVY